MDCIYSVGRACYFDQVLRPLSLLSSVDRIIINYCPISGRSRFDLEQSNCKQCSQQYCCDVFFKISSTAVLSSAMLRKWVLQLLATQISVAATKFGAAQLKATCSWFSFSTSFLFSFVKVAIPSHNFTIIDHASFTYYHHIIISSRFWTVLRLICSYLKRKILLLPREYSYKTSESH